LGEFLFAFWATSARIAEWHNTVICCTFVSRENAWPGPIVLRLYAPDTSPVTQAQTQQYDLVLKLSGL
jgi:hypothetical protein